MSQQNIILNLEKNFEKSLEWFPKVGKSLYNTLYEITTNIDITNVKNFNKLLLLTNQNNHIENGMWSHLNLECNCLDKISLDDTQHQNKLFRELDGQNFIGHIFEVYDNINKQKNIYIPVHINIDEELAKYTIIESIKTDSQYPLILMYKNKELSTIWGKDPVKFVIIKNWTKEYCKNFHKSEMIHSLYSPNSAGYKKSEQSFNTLSLEL